MSISSSARRKAATCAPGDARSLLAQLRESYPSSPYTDQAGLQKLCASLDIPILAPESLMHDLDLSARWLIAGATDWLRAHARVGTTAILKLAPFTNPTGAS